jgi:hypothetical protein
VNKKKTGAPPRKILIEEVDGTRLKKALGSMKLMAVGGASGEPNSNQCACACGGPEFPDV